MKKILLFALLLVTITGSLHGQTHIQSLTFNDNDGVGNAGTYNPTDSFSFDIFLTFSGFNAYGFDLWFATTADAAPNIFETGFVHGPTFGYFLQTPHFPLGFTLQQPDHLYTTPNPSDLGAILLDQTGSVPPGTYFLGHLSIALNGLVPGTYTLQSSSSSTHFSQVTAFDGTTFTDNNLPAATYTITVVPEPSTLTLIGLGAITGLGLVARGSLRRKAAPWF